jgi:hypothetical protein
VKVMTKDKGSSPNGLRSEASASDQPVRQGTSRVPSTRTASSETSTRTQGSRSVGRFRRELIACRRCLLPGSGTPVKSEGENGAARYARSIGTTTPVSGVRVASGGYKCMACGEHGGDVLAHHMRRYGLGFVAAVKALNAWEEVSQWSPRSGRFRSKPRDPLAADAIRKR